MLHEAGCDRLPGSQQLVQEARRGPDATAAAHRADCLSRPSVMMVFVSVLLLAVTRPASACEDILDAVGCNARITSHPGFCDSAWAAAHCCATCATVTSGGEVREAPAGCAVPRQKCVTWTCEQDGSHQPPGASCRVVAKRSASCQRCALVDADSCEPFADTRRTCQAGGTWSGPEPACRRYCDATYAPPVDELPQLDWEALAAREQTTAPAVPLTVVPIEAPPFGDYLTARKVNEYMSDRIDVFGHWLVMFTKECKKHWGPGPSLHVANQYAQWLDSNLDGSPDNAKVWAA